MADALFLLVVAGFFGLMVLLVKACDHIVGSDDPASGSAILDDPAVEDPVRGATVDAAVAPAGPSATTSGEELPMTTDNYVALAAAPAGPSATTSGEELP